MVLFLRQILIEVTMVVYMLNLYIIVLFKVGLFLPMYICKRIIVIILEKNRSLDGWSTYGEGSISLSNDQPVSKALPSHLKFSLSSKSVAASGVTNIGFYGINIQAQIYNASFFYRPLVGASVSSNKLTVGLRDSTGRITYGMSIIDVSSALVSNWTKFSTSIPIHDAAPTSNNTFFIEFPQGSFGDFEFNLISCFPPTYKERTNGARIDIANTFAELKPGFIRLPGGNDLEGRSISERFIWNNTIGPLEYRPGRKGTWTGYNTEGFGLIELLTFTEDVGATPILAVYAGYSLDGRSVPKDELQPYIDEVINEIEFLTAPADKNRMGALRASLGRREPFNIQYVEIGNEDGIGAGLITYNYRWSAYHNALSKRYPNITFIATTTAFISSPPATDDHHYRSPVYFIENFRHYEKLPRSGPKVLIGEFSVVNNDDIELTNSSQSDQIQYPSIKSAVAESVYRIGFERNSDIIIGGCYAPVLQNIADTQWTPNFILFNAGSVVKSTSYLAQQMFGQHLGNIVLNSTASKKKDISPHSIHKGEEGDGKLDKLYFIATKDTKTKILIIKFANVDSSDILVNTHIQNSSINSNGTVYTLSAGPGVDPSTVQNTLSNPNAASIITNPISIINATCSITIPSWSVVVVTIPL
jgi:alpha-N-arabinofuranosidase